MKKVAVVQSNYIPWKGYFDLINSVDEFVLFDDMQYTKRDWRNRNQIKTRDGIKWLSIPVVTKGKFHQRICDTMVASQEWRQVHWDSICHNYAKAEHFQLYRQSFEELYLSTDDEYLSKINFRFISEICTLLGITTKISWSMDYDIVEGKTERLVSICKQAGATEYISGPAARAYVQEELFAIEGIEVTYADYSGYPEYQQLFPPFEHHVSILDLMFNQGSAAHKFMKSF